MEHIRIVLADDHVLVRKGIRAMLESDEEMEVVGEAGNGQEALEAARTLKPDILVLDIRMPQMDGLEAAARVREYAPGTKAVILSMHDSEEYVLEALNADAYGYLLKDTDKEEFLKALRAVHGGSKYYTGAVSHVLAKRLLQGQGQGQWTVRREEATSDPYNLSKREKQILRLVIDGRHNKEIAEALDKSQRTIETHRFNIMKKLGVNNAIDMVNKAVRENIA